MNATTEPKPCEGVWASPFVGVSGRAARSVIRKTGLAPTSKQRRVPCLKWEGASGAFVWSVMRQGYAKNFCPESDQMVPRLPMGQMNQGVKI